MIEIAATFPIVPFPASGFEETRFFLSERNVRYLIAFATVKRPTPIHSNAILEKGLIFFVLWRLPASLTEYGMRHGAEKTLVVAPRSWRKCLEGAVPAWRCRRYWQTKINLPIHLLLISKRNRSSCASLWITEFSTYGKKAR